MKIRRSILVFCTIIAVLIALLIRFARKSAESPSAPVEDTGTAPPAAERAETEPAQHRVETPIRTDAPAARVDRSAPIPTSPLKTKAEQMKEGLAALNDEDVVLYGKVIDQFDSPVANATVVGSIQVNNGTRVGSDKLSLVTDANGLFTINGYKGKALGINVSKTGCVMAATNTRFIYSLLWPEAERYLPDPNNPVVIKMWKLQGAEPLLGIGKEYRLPFTGTPLFFDLLTGKVSDSGGDLQVVISRAPGSLSKRRPGDWSIEFKPVNGGIIESDDAVARVTYEAPAEGYQSSDRVRMKPEDAAWFDNVHKVFFLKSRGGQVYSKLNFDFRINGDPNGSMWFQFRGVANTKASRNWEGDLSISK